MLGGAIGLLLLSLTDPIHNRWGDIIRLNAMQWVALLFLSLGCSVIAYFVYNFALTKISASRVAVYIYFEPVVAIILGVTLLGERPSWQTLCGAVVIGASVAIVNMLKR
jgi:drug/metabolite transporter (DMT)-like permease